MSEKTEDEFKEEFITALTEMIREGLVYQKGEEFGLTKKGRKSIKEKNLAALLGPKLN